MPSGGELDSCHLPPGQLAVNNFPKVEMQQLGSDSTPHNHTKHLLDLVTTNRVQDDNNPGRAKPD